MLEGLKMAGSLEVWATLNEYSCLIDSYDANDSEDSKEEFIERIKEALAKPDLGEYRYEVRIPDVGFT